ncbi:MAG TPA: MBOAT family protein [Deltaproteobacteria bacterium]|nr:MBOAT family protein [Deltaproteobacteria bacterium]
MLFNSYAFILIFLPLVAAVYFLLHTYLNARWARLFLLVASLAFMSYWNIYFALVLICSVLFNYAFGITLSTFAKKDKSETRKKIILAAAITANILFLGFFKYYNFFVENINAAFSTNIGALQILLPLGISFYTFMQIAWLTDIYRHGGYRYDFFHYCLYVTFFPYVVSGPIPYHTEIIPQIQSEQAGRFNLANLCRGMFIFSIGLFKKTVIADTLAIIANGGYDTAATLTFIEAWLTSLSFSMQIYFDFSGYTDMAIGVALIFNIHLPINFNSPFKALNIVDFWRRWHLTLTRFLRDYLYIPLGGSRKGGIRTNLNIMVTFLVVGFWHGASWLFLFWGFIHGAVSIFYRYWRLLGIRMHKALAWFLFFNFFNTSAIFFRANTWHDAMKVLKGMFGLNGILISEKLADSPFWQKMTSFGIQFGGWRENLPQVDLHNYFLCIALIFVVLFTKNSNELLRDFSPNRKNALAVGVMMVLGLLLLNQASTFLYFNF